MEKKYDISLISIAKYGIIWYNLITKRKYKRGTGFMNTKYVFETNPDVDMTSIRDSMLLDLGTVIATLQKGDVKISLEVAGDVCVRFDDEWFLRPTEFPQELKDMIATGPTENNNEAFWWECDDRVYVGNNNWFEAFIEAPGYSDGVLVDVEENTVAELFSCLIDIMEQYEKCEVS